jgi:hypothetical protein
MKCCHPALKQSIWILALDSRTTLVAVPKWCPEINNTERQIDGQAEVVTSLCRSPI